RREFARRKWLGHIVVRTEFESHDAIVLIAARRQHDHWDRGLFAQAAAYFEPVDVREHEVEHDKIGPDLRRARQRTYAVSYRVDCEPCACEVPHADLAHGGVVFHHQDVGRRPVHHCDHTVNPTISVHAAWSASHGRIRVVKDAVASIAHGTNGSQM